MRPEELPTAEPPAISRRMMASSRARRPWPLIIAALLLAILSTVLWVKWRESRTRADQLQGELKQVYVEAEALRTQAVQAQQRIGQLERELRALSSRDGGAKPAAKPKGAASR
jgi:hypothetical protein